MSESILNALMDLFALIGNLSKRVDKQKGAAVLESYLNQHLSTKYTNEYLKLYDNYFEFYKKEYPAKNETNTTATLTVEKVSLKIKRGLHRNERIIVLLRLLEFMQKESIISHEELNLLSIISETFNISNPEYEDIKSFILEKDETNISDKKVLVIESEKRDTTNELEGRWVQQNMPEELIDRKHIFKENLNGKIIILYIESIQRFVFKYYGKEKLQLLGQSIVGGLFYFLSNGGIIKGQKISPIYHSDIAAHFLLSYNKAKIIFEARDLVFRFKSSSNGIHRFNFSEESGQLIGIMGGSGVGKSTLINLLNGTLKPTSGQILINNLEIHENRLKLEGLTGYVPQDDLLIDELSVHKNLYYNAKLCFRNYSERKILDTIQKILEDLDLIDIKNLKVGNPLDKYISGGQRKRLNIALELIREPYILFMDEPTSGLSSNDSEMVMLLLKEQAIKGKLVICNIHQPSSEIFKLFDKLILLDKGGYPIYNGNPIDSIEYFRKLSSHVNPTSNECPTCGNVKPEQILQLIEAKSVDEFGRFTSKRKVEPIEWYKAYQDKIESKNQEKESGKRLPHINFKIADLDKQFSVFFQRNLISKLTDKQYWIINLLEAPILGFILAYFTKYSYGSYTLSGNKSFPIFLFMSVVVALFMGLTVSAEEIIRDRKILKREAFLNLSKFSYLNAKITFLFLLSAIQTITFISISHLILQVKDMWLWHWLILFTTSCLANLIGLNISAAFKSVVTIYILVPLILVPQLLLGGAMIQFDDLHHSLTNRINVPIVGDLMATRWAYEAIAVKQFKSNKFQENFYDTERKMSEASFKVSFLIPNLTRKLEEVSHSIAKKDIAWEYEEEIFMLKNEINRVSMESGRPPFEYIKKINPIEFDVQLAEECHGYLTFLRYSCQQSYKEASSQRDSIYSQLIDSLGEEKFQRLRHNYHNEALADIVLNRNHVEKILETGNRLVQKKDPIYNFPDSKWGRSHFYSPVKNINSRLIDTFWFNFAVLWAFCGFFYVTLLSDSLRKLLEYFDESKFDKKTKS